MFQPIMIIELRKRLGYSREKLTDALGLKTRMTTRYWERGMRAPNLQNAVKLIALAKEVGLEWSLEDFTETKTQGGE